jgi:hypothetical protein
MKRFHLAIDVCFMAIVLMLQHPLAVAQDATGTITGTVSDQTGSVVPNAAVSIVETQTGIKHEATTNSSGAYTVPQLPVGIYNVSASKQGYKVAKQDGLRLNITDVARVDLSLAVGSTDETVTVTASHVELNTENAEVATTISDREVADLPLNGRNFQQLMTLDGSAYSIGSSVQNQFRGSQSLYGGGVVGAGGSRSDDVGFLIDGLNNRDIGFGSAILIPSIDALQEFKFQTATYSAEYGGASTQVQLHFKSGTNSLHGTAYEFVRNNDFDARALNEVSIPRLDQNQFGYSLGGPVYIPKLYDGRNKSFFFANYEGLRVKANSAPQYFWVPTAAQWSGSIGQNIVDPLTQQPFPGTDGQTVPAGRISQFAKAYQALALQPNSTSPYGNFTGEAGNPDNADQQNYRFDQNLGANNALFFRYSRSSDFATTGSLNGTGNSASTTTQTQNHAYQVAYTHIFSPQLVNQATFGYVFANFDTVAPTITQAQLASFGIQGGFNPQPTPEVPLLTLNNTIIDGMGTNNNWPQIDQTKYYNVADTLSYSIGDHSLTAGFSILNWSHYYGKGANLGDWTFDGRYSGNTFADLLLGNPSAYSINVPSPYAETAADAVFTFPQYTWSTYVQDAWKASRRLTINMGLRYEYLSIDRESQNRYLWFDPSVAGGAECTANQASAQAVGGNGLLQYCKQRSAPKLSFAPRFGIAYLPFPNSDKTVIRLGYGIFYNTVDGQDYVNDAGNYPYLGAESANGTPVTDILSTSNPIPPITTLRPIAASDLGFVMLGEITPRRPYSQNWNLSVEHRPLKNTIVGVSYTGSEGTHQVTRYNLNQPLQYDPSNPLSVAARRPYPIFGDVYSRIYGLSSNYNAGTATVRHESRSLVLTAAYTYSKSLDVRSGEDGAGGAEVNGWAGPMDSQNLRRDYGPSSFDVKHRAIISFVHNIPVGRGERYLSTANKPVNAIIGGWTWNGIVTVQSGFPVSIAAGDAQGLADTFSQRADVVGNPYPSGFHKSAQHWFNTAAFAQPAPGIFGNSSKGVIRGPGSENFDLSLFKNFSIAERARFQFRVESFNAFNHTNLGFPDYNVDDGPSFGTISSSAPGRIIQLGGKVIF